MAKLYVVFDVKPVTLVLVEVHLVPEGKQFGLAWKVEAWPKIVSFSLDIIK
jgi:hypothetical protein